MGNFPKILSLSGVAVMLLAAAALADAPDKALVQKRVLTLEGAKKVAAAAVEFIHKNNTSGVLAIVDDGGNLMYVERSDGTFAAGANVSIGKARTAALSRSRHGPSKRSSRTGARPWWPSTALPHCREACPSKWTASLSGPSVSAAPPMPNKMRMSRSPARQL